MSYEVYGVRIDTTSNHYNQVSQGRRFALNPDNQNLEVFDEDNKVVAMVPAGQWTFVELVTTKPEPYRSPKDFDPDWDVTQ